MYSLGGFFVHCACITSSSKINYIIQSRKNLGRPFIESQLQSLCRKFTSLDQRTLWSCDRALHPNWAFFVLVFHSIGDSFAPTLLAPVHAQIFFCLDFLSDHACSIYSSLSLWVSCGLSESSIWFDFIFGAFGNDLFKYFPFSLSLGHLKIDCV